MVYQKNSNVFSLIMLQEAEGESYEQMKNWKLLNQFIWNHYFWGDLDK